MNAIQSPPTTTMASAADQAAGPMRQLLVFWHSPALAPDAASLKAQRLELRSLPAEAMTDAAVFEVDALSGVDVILTEVQPADNVSMNAVQTLLRHVAGRLPVIALVDGLTVQAMRQLLHLGVVDALPMPLSAADLRQSVDALPPVQRQATVADPAPARHGRVISFLGAIGGVGNSSIATQTGILWAEDMRVGYIDFDMQFGNAALLLDLRPALHIGHLIDDSERMDADLLQSVASDHVSGLSLIASPTEMMPIEVIDSEFVDRLLRLARQNYDIVIADLPTLWSEWTMRILQRSDIVCMVTDLSVPSLYQARRQLEMVDANGLMPRLKVVANRVQKGMFARINLKETEAALGRKIEFSVANDYPAVSAANDQGRAVKEVRPASRVLKDLDYLSKALAAAAVSDEVSS